MEIPKPSPVALKRLRTFGIALGVFLVLFGAFGFFAGPPIARSVLTDLLQKELHRPVKFGDISINPYALSVRVTGVSVGDNEGGEAFGFDELYVNLGGFASLRHTAPVVKEIRLAGLRIRVARTEPGRYSISDLLDEWLKPSDKPTPQFSVNNIRLSGGRVEFEDRPVGKTHVVSDINISLPFVSNLAYQADVFTEPSFSAVVNGAPLTLAGKTKPFAPDHESELGLALNRFELAPYLAYVPMKLPFAVAGGQLDTDLRLVFRQPPKEAASLDVVGRVSLSGLKLLEDGQKPLLNLGKFEVPLAAVAPLNNRFHFGAVSMEGLEIFVRPAPGGINWQALAGKFAQGQAPKPEAKADAKPAAAKPDAKPDAKADAKPDAKSDAKPDAKPAAKDAPKALDVALGGFTLTKAALRWQDGPGAELERFEIKDVKLDAPRKLAGIGEVLVSGLRLSATRLPDGSIAGLKALTGESAKPAAKPTAKPAAKADAGWTVELGRFALADSGLKLDDRAVKPAAVQTVDLTKLTLDKFSTAPKTQSTLELSAQINKSGSLALGGTVQLSPLAVKLKYDVKGFPILPLMPYVADKLNITITRGQLTTDGELNLAADPKGELAGTVKSQLTLGNFHSVDKQNSADFLTWKSLHLGRVNVNLKPMSLSMGDVALADFYARVIVSPEGKLNLLDIVKKEPGKEGEAQAAQNATAPAPAAKAPEQPAQAQSGQAAQTAPEQKPMAVRIDQVTLQAGTVSITDHFVRPNYSAKLAKIGGKVAGLSSDPGSTADMNLRGEYDGAPVSIVGKLNPLSPSPALDIKTEVRGVELTPFSPYSGKYAGYNIQKGKLSLYLSYKIENRKLEAQNRVFLDQLTFGDKVDSPTATKLPVTLAVALLKNRKGEIDINLPISGSLDDPQFSVGGIIVQVIINLLGKAITSPFALIGSLFGGGEELSYVDFAPGRSQISPEAAKRLETVVKILDDRPNLKLEIAGRTDPEKDVEGLRHAFLDRSVKERKHAQLVKARKEVGGVDEVAVDDKEYAALLEQAYKQAKFPKPRNFIGLTKSLPPEEMEKLMLANAPTGEAELRELADARAKAVAEWLRANSQIPADRVFLLPPKQKGDTSGPKEAPLSRADFSLK